LWGKENTDLCRGVINQDKKIVCGQIVLPTVFNGIALGGLVNNQLIDGVDIFQSLFHTLKFLIKWGPSAHPPPHIIATPHPNVITFLKCISGII